MRNIERKDLKPGTRDNPKEWGLWDKKQNCWLGTTEAPYTWDDYEVARIAARVLAARMEVCGTSIEVQKFTSASRKIEDFKPHISAEKALFQLENGLIL